VARHLGVCLGTLQKPETICVAASLARPYPKKITALDTASLQRSEEAMVCKLPGVADLLAEIGAYSPAHTLSDVPPEENRIVRQVLTSAGPAAAVPNATASEGSQLSNAWQSVPSHRPPRNLNIQPEVSPPKTRTVRDPEMTGHVRQLGACYYCRIRKSRVSNLHVLRYAIC
jgi:hypothetical protein